MASSVINVSAPAYNLGAHKLTDWLRTQGQQVTSHDGDPGLFGGHPTHVYLSVLFSWHAPRAAELAWRYKPYAEVCCGGPGMFALGRWWQQQTGLTCHRGLDWQFERQRGDYRMTFASRGCPVNCHFCIVPRIEGTMLTLDWEFVPAPILCDNNLSALPVAFQDHIVRQYQATQTPLIDANSGFEPHTFTEETYRRWQSILRGPWRLAFDTSDEAPAVQRMLQILAKAPARRRQVYVLIGNEPLAACYARAQQVITWGGEPYVQPLLPLNALRRDAYKIAHDWTAHHLRDFQRYYNRHLWRTVPLRDYRPRQDVPRPFAGLEAC
jgi:hypothetical protein